MTTRYTRKTLASAVLGLALVLPGCAAHHGGPQHHAELSQELSAHEQAVAFVQNGEKLEKNGQNEAAFEHYARAVATDPAYTRAHYKKGLILLEQGLSDKAMAEFEAVLAVSPEDAKAHEAAGIAYFRSALYPEAERHLTRAIALDKHSHRAYAHLGAIHNYKGEYDKAVTCFELALEKSGDNAALYNNIGMSYTMQGNEKKAVEAFSTALRLGAPSRRTYNNMGLALARMGHYRQALEAFRNAEGEAGAFNNLGYVYFMKGEYDPAIACFEKAISLEPGYYERASENLKRARLAREFAAKSDSVLGSLPSARADVPLTDSPRIRNVDSSLNFMMNKDAIHSRPLNPTPLGSLPVYSVHVCSWRTIGKANKAARRLIRQGYDAHVYKVRIKDKGDWYRVTAGEFMEVTEARELQDRLKDVNGYRNLRIIKRSRGTSSKSNT